MNKEAAMTSDELDELRASMAHDIKREASTWLVPLLAGGLSAARTAPIGPTAERLAETILIALENTVRGNERLFDEALEELPY
jgi:hypothetical protein